MSSLAVVGGASTEELWLAVMGVALLCGAVGFVYLGYRDAQSALSVLRPPSLASVGAPSGDESVTVEGPARVVDEPVETPVSGESVVAYEYERQRRIKRRRSRVEAQREAERLDIDEDDHRAKWEYTWETQEEEARLPPFDVETDEGRIRVDPAGARMDIELEAVHRDPWWKRIDLKLPVVGRIERGSDVRELEAYIREGESVFVSGVVDPDDAPDGTIGVVGDTETDRPYVTTQSPLGIRLGAYRAMGRFLLPAGGCLLFGVALLAYLL